MSKIFTATATALVAATMLVPAASAQTAPVVESGTVNWPVKTSFVSYLQTPLASGTITASEGARKVPATGTTQSFDFPVNAAQTTLDAQGNGTIWLNGALHFTGHEGQLDLTYKDIKVLVTGTTAKVTADYTVIGSMPGREGDAGPRSADDAVIASYTLPKPITGSYQETSQQGKIEQGGVDSLLNYELGTAVDPLKLNLTYAGQPNPNPTPNPGTGTDSSSIEGNSPLEKAANGIAVAIAVIGVGMALIGLIKGFAEIFDFRMPELPQLPQLPRL